MKNLPYIIVGAGITGITIAQRLSQKTNSKIFIFEKRSHIGGNTFDYYDCSGILVHKYGPHIFHTNNKRIWSYVNRFAEWNDYVLKVKAYIGGKLVSIPININTMKDLYNTELNQRQMKSYFENFNLKKEITNSEEYLISRIGKDLYEKIYKNYIAKQWDLEVKDLDQSVVKRLPIRTNNDDRYFTDKYQGVPKEGYTKMLKKMLDNTNIEIYLNSDYNNYRDDIEYKHLFYSAPIDEFYNFKFGRLEYRGLNFKIENHNVEYYQPFGVVSYPNNHKYTRITEFKHLTKQKNPVTTIVKEYPSWNGEKYYPVLTKKNIKILSLYQNQSSDKNISFVGRLGKYKYFNMDQAIENSLNDVDKITSEDKV